MRIRPKTIRRLLFLFTVLAVVAGALVWAVHRSQQRNAVALATLRADAMAAYKAGDYARAVYMLGDYLSKSKAQDTDPDALYAYGKSRISVEAPHGRHVTEGIGIYQRYRAVRPQDDVARHELLDLYARAAYNAEAIKLADEVLAANPKDVPALTAKVRALNNQRKFTDALAVSRTLNAVDPLDVQGQLVTAQLMQKSGATEAEIIGHAQALASANPNDPRFELLLAYAHMQAKHEAEAKHWLTAAAGRAPPDATFVAELTRRLDAAGLYPDATAYLRRAADALPDAGPVQRLLAQRLWQDLKFDELTQRFAKVDPTKPAGDGVLIAYRALALYVTGHAAEAGPLAEAAAKRPDAPAAAFGAALLARYANPPLSPTVLVARLTEAVGRTPENPVVRVMLGEAMLRTNETELAMDEFVQSARLAPSWATPFVLVAQTLTATNRPADALNCANEAQKRAPGRYDTETTRVQAAYALMSRDGRSADYAKLLPVLAEIHKTWNNDAQTLPTYVSVLARTGQRDKAIEMVQAALAAAPALPAHTLLRLADVADAEKLGDVAAAARAQAQKGHGLTPEIALADARSLLQEGKAPEGLRVVTDAAKGHDNDAQWRLVIAAYREMSHDPAALKEWAAIGEQYPADLQVQEAILRAPSRFKDRALWAKAIDRTKAVGGEQGLLWKIQRAQWLLSGEPTEKENAEVVSLLTQVTNAAPALPEPHRLLASAMQRVKNTDKAISELTAAADARPGDPAITGDLVRLLIASNKTAAAMAYLDKLAQNPRLSMESRHWLARTYADQGYPDKAMALLASETTATGETAAERDWMMARLHRRVGHMEEAGKLYKALLPVPIPDPAVWMEGADFFAAQKDMGTAEQFMQRLGELPAGRAPGAMELARGQFAERWSTEADALAHYQAAVKAAPKSENALAALAGFHLRRGQFADAATDAAAGLATLPDSAALKALQSHAAALASLDDAPEYQPLAEALSRNPLDPGATEMLKAVAGAQADKLAPDATAQRIRAVADKYPDALTLQTQAVRSYVRANHLDLAAEVARRAAELSPANPEPHRMLTAIYAANAEWTKAIEEAQLWRQRTPDQPYAADLMLAQIYLQQPKKDAAGALRVLKPYASERDAAEQKRAAVELYAKALVLEGRGAAAADLLKPLLANSPAWRVTWLELAMSHKNADVATDWVQQVVGLIPADSVKEQYALAKTWCAVGTQFDAPKALDAARKILDGLAARDGAPAQTWVLIAITAQAQGDYAAAEAAYRRVAKENPASADARNDLAYVLWLRGQPDDLPEAKKLAAEAVAARPEVASFYDTLARIESRTGDGKSAIEHFRIALKKDPASLEAMIGLADLLAQQSTGRDEAKDVMSQIQRLMQANPPLSPILRKQYQTVRQTLAGSI